MIERISGISSMAMREALAELTDSYGRASGRAVTIVSVGGVDAVKRVRDGEIFDFVVLAADSIVQLAAAGRVDAATRTDLARSAIAVAIRAGASRPDVGSESAVRDAVLRARIVGLSTGPSGAHLAGLFRRWGIADAIAARLLQASPGISIGTLVASDDVELGFQQLSELMHVPGIEIIGMLPTEIQAITVFSAAVCTDSSRPVAARALLSFLSSSEADAAMRRHGLEPTRSRS